MPDTKITALTAISTVNPATYPLPIVDTADTTMAASGTTKKITVNQILGSGGTATLASATITGDLTVDTNTLKVVSATDSVGVGFTPSAWGGGRKAIQIGSPAQLASADLTLEIGSNWWHDGTNYKYTAANPAALYSPSNGSHSWYNASAGLVNGTIGWSTLMTLNSTGLGVGVVPSAGKFEVQESGTGSGIGGIFTSTVSGGGNPGVVFRTASTNRWSLSLTGSAGAESIRFYDINNSATRLLIDTSGNVGIGVTPSAWWNGFKAVESSNGVALLAQTNVPFAHVVTNASYNGTSWLYKTNSNYANRYAQDGTTGQHQWFTAPLGGGAAAGTAFTFTQAMTLDASGNLLVGRTGVAGAERLCVEKDVATNEIVRFRATNATDPYGVAIQYIANISTAGNDFAAYYVNGTTIRFGFRSNGGMANYQANNVNLSDSRTKTDIKPLGSYWNKIKSLEVVTFKYKDQGHNDDNIGLIAQQVESVAPEFVDDGGFGKTPEDGIPLKTIYTTDLYHAAIKALQEAMARIEVLEAKLA